MESIKDFFKGQAKFEVNECDYLLLNRLRMFHIRDVSFDESVNRMRFTVPLRFLNNVKAVLARHKYSVRTNTNVFGILNIFYTRIALSIAAVIFTVVFFILNGFVFNVKVIGIEGKQASEVAAFVYSKGARPFMHKSSSRASEVAGEIVGNFDYVAHASSKIVGNTLIFNIYNVSVAEEADAKDIVAAMDGVITNVIAASGRTMVSVGDFVRVGQVLIKAERQVGAIDVGRDEFGKLIQEGVFAPCRAVGEVLADVKYSEYGTNMTVDALLAKIILRTGIQNFDKVESFSSSPGVLEVVATINISIV